MATKEECDRYAIALAQRFEELTDWAVANWPRKDEPLLKSDFDESRKELSRILGPKLGDGDGGSSPPDGGDDGGQYRELTPMPWP
jgi:hypothetical protein